MTILRIRDENPVIETTFSNLSFALGTTCNDSPFDHASIAVRNNRAQFGSSCNVTTTFFRLQQTSDGVAICGAEPLFPELQPVEFEPTLSFRTRTDLERARIDANGIWATSVQADAYLDLTNDYVTSDTRRPASAAALATAYEDLSNLIRTFIGSNAVAYPPSSADVTLVDSYLSPSITDAPTAGALRSAYLALSNQFYGRFISLSSTFPNMIYNATQAALNAAMLSSNDVGGGPVLTTDAWLNSTPDTEPRLFFGFNGKTIFASGGDFMANGSFEWRVNDTQTTVATLDGTGNLWAGGDIDVEGSVSASNGTYSGALSVGDVPITAAGSNLGINLPPGVPPEHALHVNGLVYSDEGVYALSDAREKTGIAPLENALETLRGVRGYSYERRGRRRLGVIAQELIDVVPEAVITTRATATEGSRMAVSYADLVALLVEAVNELAAR